MVQKTIRCQVIPKMDEPSTTQDKVLPTKVSFKGGSPPSHIPDPTFFLAFLRISGTRFLLRVVVCNIPKFSKFWNMKRKFKNECFPCYVDLKIHKELKTFVYFVEI